MPCSLNPDTSWPYNNWSPCTLNLLARTSWCTKRPEFVVTYDPGLPSVSSLQAKHWRSMVSRNKYLAEVFPSPPLTDYRRQQNLRSYLIRATVAKGPDNYPKRNQWGMKKCNQPNCTACPFNREGKNITINGAQWRLMKSLNCNSYNIVYAIACKKETWNKCT